MFISYYLPLSVTVKHNVERNVSSGHKSEKIEAKLLLWWSKDKSRRLLLRLCFQVCVLLGFSLLQVLLCGWCLAFDVSSPVENRLLWWIWHDFDLSWCNLCWEWRNLSTNTALRPTVLSQFMSNFYCLNESAATIHSPLWMSLYCLLFSSSIFFL